MKLVLRDLFFNLLKRHMVTLNAGLLLLNVSIHMSGGTPASVKTENTRYILHFFKNKPFARAERERERERERKKASDVFDDASARATE